MPDPYIAHSYDAQEPPHSVFTHNSTVAAYAGNLCPLPLLVPLVWLGAIYHDAGKYRQDFQNYINNVNQERSVKHAEKVDHATPGGQLIEELLPGSNVSNLLQFIIYSHHGQYDALSPDGELLFSRRLQKECQLDTVRERYYRYMSKETILNTCEGAQKNLVEIMHLVQAFEKNGGKEKVYGNKDFCMGMYERILLSLLVDGDRTDTACYREKTELPEIKTETQIQEIWEECIHNYDDYMIELSKKASPKPIDKYRNEISKLCLNAAYTSRRLYRLTVPTGAGKTLSSLRFALHHAKQFHKRHIIYIAPYNSILEQNAITIGEAVKNEKWVLEHHCNVIHETQEKRREYELLTENWDSPIIVTTAVQLLNTLFDSSLSSVRRMYQLCSSVIIFDEIQSLPVRCMQLFNMAVNFLTSLADTTVVLCSATQPLLDQVQVNRLLPVSNVIEPAEKYREALKRTVLVDKTMMKQGGLTIEDLGKFVLKQAESKKQILIVVNTKKCAENLYHYLKQQDEIGYIIHLSTNMCAENRREVLEATTKLLKQDKPVIGISTQLIEAGVDISFKCVIRSLAGLDNLIQAAGRCNRHDISRTQEVYIVRMNREAEDLSHLKEIRQAQEAMEQVLEIFRKETAENDGFLMSEAAISKYYAFYFRLVQGEMSYKVSGFSTDTSLADLLSKNEEGISQYHKKNKKIKCMLKQAFKTAGDLFEAIPEDGKIDVVVAYNKESTESLDRLRSGKLSIGEQKEEIRKLQRYTVGISESRRNLLGQAVSPICDGRLLELYYVYYSHETGISDTPVNMGFMNC